MPGKPHRAVDERNAAIDDLVLEARPRLIRILRRFRIPPEDAEDVLHEVLVLLVERWDSVRDPLGWLIRVLSNQCIMYWRRRHSPAGRLVEPVEDQALERLAGSATPSQALFPDWIAVHEELARAPERDRAIFVAYALGHTQSELAATARRSSRTVRKIVAHLRRRLRTVLHPTT